MGSALLSIHIEGFGETWSNTHGIALEGAGGTMSLGEMTTLAGAVAGGGYTVQNTNPADAGYVGTTDIVGAVIGFQRLLLSDECQVTGFTLNDGTTPGAATGPFWSQVFALPGLYDLSQANSAPLSIAWLIGRTPAAIATRTGHLNLRAALNKSGLEPGRRVGVQFINDVVRTERANALNSAVTASALNNYMSPAQAGGAEYVIPVYGKVGTGNAGQVVGGHPVRQLSSINPTSRQKPRGRKRAA